MKCAIDIPAHRRKIAATPLKIIAHTM